ncbi:hypothetical protein [Anaerotignum sp.]|uniref:hypothetical protein n=1 Tax=Anaerotignum sp. TaxID=2039241 RepID=UPI003329B933
MNKRIIALLVGTYMTEVKTEKRRSFGYAVSPFCRSLSKTRGCIPTRLQLISIYCYYAPLNGLFLSALSAAKLFNIIKVR